MILVAELDWELKREIEDIVDYLACTRVTRFYPTYIHRITKIPLDKVFHHLSTMVGDKRLALKWEIRCPNLDCESIITCTERIQDYIDKYIECDYCENDVLVSKSIVFPVFVIDSDYRGKIYEIKKKEINPLKVL